MKIILSESQIKRLIKEVEGSPNPEDVSWVKIPLLRNRFIKINQDGTIFITNLQNKGTKLKFSASLGFLNGPIYVANILPIGDQLKVVTQKGKVAFLTSDHINKLLNVVDGKIGEVEFKANVKESEKEKEYKLVTISVESV